MSLLGTKTFGSASTLASLRAKGYEHWKRQRVIESGHTDNLVYDDGNFRVWVSRMGLEDYNGDRRAWMADRMTIERRTGGGWVRV